jgi:hypothetical protein
MKKLMISLGLTVSLLGASLGTSSAQAGSRDNDQLAAILIASAVTTAIIANSFDEVDVHVTAAPVKHYAPRVVEHHYYPASAKRSHSHSIKRYKTSRWEPKHHDGRVERRDRKDRDYIERRYH